MSQLTQDTVNDADYNFTCRILEELDSKYLGEYSDLYLKTDAVLLDDILKILEPIVRQHMNQMLLGIIQPLDLLLM
ncbi:hypothetical protein J437_LFUL001364 [Ladona fulva]|uniref:Uncharacterized protein n=1 Tax=Ladona fulva TaxID=123851 RepID=A0A8K0JYG4_LADFU|nr:hypothetical protein J437_LFUL001364 [Ladona fulva]